jgi:hypothetical protein
MSEHRLIIDSTDTRDSRESIVMKSATPLFMIVMLVGIMFIYASVVMYAIDHSDVVCNMSSFSWVFLTAH